MKISYIAPVRTEEELNKLRKKSKGVILYSLPTALASEPIIRSILNTKSNINYFSSLTGISSGSIAFFLGATAVLFVVGSLPERDTNTNRH